MGGLDKPAGDVELAGHVVHALAPGASLYFPASHAVHVPPLGPEKPGLHVQDARDALPIAEIAFGGQPSQTSELFAATITENLPAAHAWHAAEDEAPTVGENVPAPQSLQPASPTKALKVPAAHGSHDEVWKENCRPATQPHREVARTGACSGPESELPGDGDSG